MFSCYKCGSPVPTSGKPGFQDICDSCGSYLHCCMNCRFFDELGGKCKEPVAEWVSDRLSFNRCEYFQLSQPRTGPAAPQRDAAGMDEEGRRFKKADWRNVHKKGRPFAPRNRDQSDRARQARRNLEDLFRKGDQ